jgi:methyl coenzyme M reductase beta subunit
LAETGRGENVHSVTKELKRVESDNKSHLEVINNERNVLKRIPLHCLHVDHESENSTVSAETVNIYSVNEAVTYKQR